MVFARRLTGAWPFSSHPGDTLHLPFPLLLSLPPLAPRHLLDMILREDRNFGSQLS